MPEAPKPATWDMASTSMYVLVVLPAPTPATSPQVYQFATYDTRPCPPMNQRNKNVVRALLEAALDQLDRGDES